MLIKITDPFPVSSSEITPEALYAGRRRFLKQLGLVAGASIGGFGSLAAVVDERAQPPSLNVARKSEMAGGESLTPYEAITHYNNYYEFGTEKDDPARNAGRLRTRPWSVVVDGECEAPGHIDLDDLIKPQVLEERIYRHRCVEGWSMVAPWVGFPLADVLKRFRPTSKAKYVAFYTLLDRLQMPDTARDVLNWPYREGLRIDEAMHPLAFLSVGLYGRVFAKSERRTAAPHAAWKIWIQSIKSIMRMQFAEQRRARQLEQRIGSA